MADVSTAAAPEGVLHRRIEFHLARMPHAAVAVSGSGFRMETLNPDAAGKAGPAAPAAVGNDGEATRSAKGELGGMDPELSVARFYLGRIGAGLQNLGNTCYLNSVLQCLTYTEPFAAYLQSGKHKSSCRTTGFCALCALQNHVKTALQSTGKIVTPSHLVRNLRCISRNFRNSRQEDAHELMVNLLESMHKCCLPSGVPSESPSAYDKSLVHKIFGGRLRSQVKCTRCSHCSNKFDPFLDLSLDIAKATTLVRALQNFTEEELLDGGEKQYQCERCRQKVVAKKRFTIDKAPNVLTVHLKRFSPFNPRDKIDKKVDFQPVLDLKPFVSDSKGTDFKYSLYGVLVHAGWNTQSGHYYCFVRTSSGMWHNLDDNQVRQVREADVLKQKAYMLFYVRESIGNSVARRDSSTANVPAKRTPEKIACLNGLIQSGLVAQKLNGTSMFGDSVHGVSIGYSGSVSKTLEGHCLKGDVKTGGGATSENNGMPSKQVQSSTSLINTSGKQTGSEGSLQELLPKADAVKDTSVASTMANGASTLSEADKQTSRSQIIFSMPIAHVDDTSKELHAQASSKKDAAVSNGIMPRNGCLGFSGKVKALPESVEQTNEMTKAVPFCQSNISPRLVQVDCRKEICSGGSSDACNGDVAKKVNIKSKKITRYPVVNMWLGSRQLLVASIKLRKKTKHKRTKRRSVVCKDMVSCSGDSVNGQLASTSATGPSETVKCTSGLRGRAYASASPEDSTQSSKAGQNAVGACAPADANATSSGTDLPKSGLGASADQKQSRETADAKLGLSLPVSIRATDLTETTVPRWDNIDLPNIKVADSLLPKRKSIGYVLDDWDEEYDRGKTKKVRNSKEDFGGPNPFQEEANYASQWKMKHKSYQGKSWNSPNRTDELRT